MFRAYDTRIIWHIESIISQEQVIVAVTVDDFGCLSSLPAIAFLTGKDTLAIGLCITVTPRVSQFLQWFTRLRIYLNDRESAMPRTVGQPVFTFWRNDVRRVDGIP